MLIALLGPPQSGKRTVAAYLQQHHSYTLVHISTAQFESHSKNEITFSTSSDFLDYATRNWRCNFVTFDLQHKVKLAEFLKRPFVVVVGLEAPVMQRWKRQCLAFKPLREQSPLTLEEFVTADDHLFYGASIDLTSLSLSPGLSSTASPLPSPSLNSDSLPRDPLSLLLPLSTHTLSSSPSLPIFLASIPPLLPLLLTSLRPAWDAYFMLLASLASLRSNCMKRRVGAVLVRERRVVSTGYNGTPRGVKNCGEGGCGRCNGYGNGLGEDHEEEGSREEGGEGMGQRSGGNNGSMGMGQGLDECLCLHAEENALLEAGRERVSGGGTEGAILYCNTCPCLRCTVKIVQCGVKEVVYSLSYSMDAASRRVMEEAGVGLRQIEMPEFPRS